MLVREPATTTAPTELPILQSDFEVLVKDNDDGSGVHGDDPVLATLAIRNADGEQCRELGDLTKRIGVRGDL